MEAVMAEMVVVVMVASQVVACEGAEAVEEMVGEETVEE